MSMMNKKKKFWDFVGSFFSFSDLAYERAAQSSVEDWRGLSSVPPRGILNVYTVDYIKTRYSGQC